MKNKKFLFISLLILAIGFAAVSTTLYISGNLLFGTNKNDFDIYFSGAILDDVDVYENVISEDKKTILEGCYEKNFLCNSMLRIRENN